MDGDGNLRLQRFVVILRDLSKCSGVTFAIDQLPIVHASLEQLWKAVLKINKVWYLAALDPMLFPKLLCYFLSFSLHAS